MEGVVLVEWACQQAVHGLCFCCFSLAHELVTFAFTYEAICKLLNVNQMDMEVYVLYTNWAWKGCQGPIFLLF